MEHHESVHLGAPGERRHVARAGMAPSHASHVLLVGVLAIVHQQMGAMGERESRDPLCAHSAQVRAQPGLMIGDVGQRAAAVLDPIPDRRARVQDGMRREAHRPDRPGLAGRIVEGDARRYLRQVHREERRREVGGDSLVERGDRRGRAHGKVGLGDQIGANMPSPSMWSTCRCVRRMSIRETEASMRDSPRERAPFPRRARSRGRRRRGSRRTTVAAVSDRLRSRRGDRARHPQMWARTTPPGVPRRSRWPRGTRPRGRRAGRPSPRCVARSRRGCGYAGCRGRGAVP